MSCPAPAEIERAYWSSLGGDPHEADRELHAHVEACRECSAQFQEIAGLAARGQRIEPSAWQRREDVRTALLSRARTTAKVPAPASRWRWIVPAILSAAAATVLVLRWPSKSEGSHEVPASHAVILDHGATRRLVVSSSPDEIVRLVDGAVTVSVGPLADGERFRVVTGDGEVDARDAALDVTVVNDRLVSVRAIRGAATVKVASFERVIRTGETWTSASELAIPTVSPAPSPAPSPVVTPAVVAVVPVVPRVDNTQAPVLPRRAPVPSGPERELVPEPSIVPPPAPAPTPRSMVQQAFDDGWAAMRAGDFTTAATAFERATAVTTDQRMLEDATYWRGVALARAGEVGVAGHVFAAFIVAYPASTRATEVSAMLGWILLERGDAAEARLRFEAALKSASPEVRESAAAGLQATTRR